MVQIIGNSLQMIECSETEYEMNKLELNQFAQSNSNGNGAILSLNRNNKKRGTEA